MVARSIRGIFRLSFRFDRAHLRTCEASSLGHFSGWKQLGGLDADEESYHAPGARECAVSLESVLNALVGERVVARRRYVTR